MTTTRYRRRWEALGALGLFVVCAIVLTWPLCRNFTTHVPGDNGDSFAVLWNYWYVPYSLTEPGVSVWYTKLQLAPYGAHLIFHTNCILPALVAWPLNTMWGVAAGCNGSLLLALVLTGWGTFLLCRDGGASRWAAVLGGFAFAFCPFVFAHLPGHYTIVQTQFIPFALLFLRWSLRGERRAWLDAIGLGVCVWGAAVTDLTVFVTTVMLLCVCVVALIIEQRGAMRWRRSLFSMGLSVVVAVVLALPWVRAYLVARSGHDYTSRLPWAGCTLYTHPRELLVPPVFHGLWGKWANPGAGFMPWNYTEGGAYLGWTCVLLAFAAAVLRRRWTTFLWIGAMLVFINLSAGNRYSPAAQTGWKWLMLGRWLPQIPVLDQVRIPARFSLGAHFCLAILVGFGVDALRALRWRQAWPAIIAPLLVLDFWFAPLPLLRVGEPPAYCDFLARQSGTALILPVGVGSGTGYNAGMLQTQQLIDQRVHRRPLMCGYLSRIPNDVGDRMATDPVFNALLTLQKGKEPERAPDAAAVQKFVRDVNIRWIVAGPEYGPESPLGRFLKSKWPLGEARVFGDATVYAVTAKQAVDQSTSGTL